MIKFWHRNTTAFFRSSVEESCNGSFSYKTFHRCPKLTTLKGETKQNQTKRVKLYCIFRNELFEDSSDRKLISSDYLTLFVDTTRCSDDLCTKSLSQYVESYFTVEAFKANFLRAQGSKQGSHAKVSHVLSDALFAIYKSVICDTGHF